MLIGSLVVGLVLGLLLGGHLTNLASVRLRLVQLIFLGLALRYVTQFAIEDGNTFAGDLRLVLFGGGFLLLLAGLWANRDLPGLPLAFVGVLLNAVAITTNGGYMPVWAPSIAAAGLPETELGSAFHRIVGLAGSGVPGDFLAAAGPLGDVIPIPIPFIRNVASIGDLFLAFGLAFFLFAILVRDPLELEAANVRAALRRRTPFDPAAERARSELAIGAEAATFGDAGLVRPSALERGLALGGSAVGSEGTVPPRRWVSIPFVPPFVERVRHHPYVRLALDGSFSALWAGQLVSALGDRIHQVALAFVVFDATDSIIALGAVFFVATLPNLLFSPLAGTFVDRWDHREVMIVSDLLRAGVVLLIPLAAVTNLALAYPLVFLVTTISIFFRPAKAAILPRIVASEDLIPANSAIWIGETFADVVGYAIAGLFVALLGTQTPLAFWIDAVTYIASALLIASIAVSPLSRTAASTAREAAEGLRGAVARFATELREGFAFLRADGILTANTLQATAGQFMLGIFLTLTPVLVADHLDRGTFTDREAYGFIEAAIGAGNLVGGFVIGLIGTRYGLGRLVIAGYAITGLLVAVLPLSGTLLLALGIAFGMGAGNLVFVIPSQTLFQRRVPAELMGRVLGLRFSVVFGSLTIATAVGGVLGEWFGAGAVLMAAGLITVGAGLAGVLVPAVRDA